MSTTYRLGSAVSGADRSIHVWKLTPLGRFGAYQVVTVCPPSPYGVLFSNRPGAHSSLEGAVEALAASDSPCRECADATEVGAS